MSNDPLVEAEERGGHQQVLPKHVEMMLSERERALNRMPPEQLARMGRNGEVDVWVDRGLALKAAGAGVPIGALPMLMAIAAQVSPVAGILGAIFYSLWALPAGIVAGVILFRAARSRTASAVRREALANPRLLDVLMRKGVVWFREW